MTINAITPVERTVERAKSELYRRGIVLEKSKKRKEQSLKRKQEEKRGEHMYAKTSRQISLNDKSGFLAIKILTPLPPLTFLKTVDMNMCDICEKDFERRHHMLRHKITVHAQEQNSDTEQSEDMDHSESTIPVAKIIRRNTTGGIISYKRRLSNVMRNLKKPW